MSLIPENQHGVATDTNYEMFESYDVQVGMEPDLRMPLTARLSTVSAVVPSQISRPSTVESSRNFKQQDNGPYWGWHHFPVGPGRGTMHAFEQAGRLGSLRTGYDVSAGAYFDNTYAIDSGTPMPDEFQFLPANANANAFTNSETLPDPNMRFSPLSPVSNFASYPHFQHHHDAYFVLPGMEGVHHRHSHPMFSPPIMGFSSSMNTGTMNATGLTDLRVGQQPSAPAVVHARPRRARTLSASAPPSNAPFLHPSGLQLHPFPPPRSSQTPARSTHRRTTSSTVSSAVVPSTEEVQRQIHVLRQQRKRSTMRGLLDELRAELPVSLRNQETDAGQRPKLTDVEVLRGVLQLVREMKAVSDGKTESAPPATET
ncbi:uncharacterized protein EV422DRAFT_390029 [Fimicolochytrium jonesii]|uniref:uncharacterized protein n=1 Tax=Fimicolochytrium jonesii TaxID=1396493 RepID=UPI0022FE59F2|nr:uncharacterized protein EV422DRAFT_390029 [Fimicolochytrium jonesii]KAI8823057.1 hypothetical protein EV422DRAFT_390029 [Fimicolochytrium jonesii]